MLIRPDCVYGRGSGRDLCLDIFTPNNPITNLHTGVIQLHPGGFRVGNRKMIQARSEALSSLGFTCFAADYRLVPEAPWPAQIHDVKATIRWVRAHADEWDIDPDRILLQGFSAGAHLALFAAGTQDNPAFEGDGGQPDCSTKVAAVVALYPPTAMFHDPDEAAFGNQYPVADMEAWNHHLRGYEGVPSWVLLGLGASEDTIRRASPTSYISSAFPPTLLMHGTADILVPFRSTVRFHEALLTAGGTSELYLFGGQPHGFDAAQSFLRLTQEASALFYRRTILEPDLIPREFNEAMVAMMAQLPANMRPPGMPPLGSPQGTSGSAQAPAQEEEGSMRRIFTPTSLFGRKPPAASAADAASSAVPHPQEETSMAISDTSDMRVTTELHELIRRSEELRKEFAQTSAQVDARGEDPTDNMRRLGEAGINRIHVPQEYGGLSTGALPFGFQALTEILTQISAGEGSTGMIFGVQSLVLREIFNPHTELPESTRQQLAREILDENARFVASNAETGTSGHVTARKVSGGIEVTGTKTFNTGSGGARYASVGLVLEGMEGMHHALVPLNAAGVKQYHDWDNMGQRATVSQTITYEDVFVPDGWHYHATALDPLFIPGVFLLHGALELGIGLGGFDAMLDYVRTVGRTILPGLKGPAEDPLIQVHVGDFSTKLAAAHALQREVAHQVETFAGGPAEIGALVAHAMRAKAASVDAALTTTAGMHDLTGARSTANTYRLDRFWRNARTFSVHDATDHKLYIVGAYELTGQIPQLIPAQVRI